MDDNQHDDNQQQEHHEGQQDQNQDHKAAGDPQVAKLLEDARNRATEALTPLLGNLDIDAETKYNLCMDTLRSTDDPHLIPIALDAALAIEDANIKAQALVGVVNEINYQQHAKTKA